ncbi:D-alanyl-D-alanine carboxypeptidase [Leptolyngbya sp. NIES-2104]|uniref:D-alanyl-D-alanine carboxypeptidase n=1 Tax=Leptolyngbya sp. NIES-2104 TaxID=1552121 RepID=UPI0006EC8068|nr:D-alanyl-D-alanine carboxypeptidase [Leptolyngbya sp. NIES-2104]GAP98675.1 D-alanyl-D-alanine carboxypeptidase [Leptolyngbya sp. NIES-2104]
MNSTISMMRRSDKNALIQTRQVIKATAVIASISLGFWSHPEVATAQTPQAAVSTVCARDLATRIDRIIQQPRFRSARWGIVIKPIEKSTILYQHNPNLSLIPASNVKLLTTAAALQLADRAPSNFQNWLTVVNRYSDNDRADALRRRIGGQSAIRSALTNLGIDANTYAQVDGSGLSRSNRVTPAALVTLLEAMFTDPRNELFHRSLAVAGVNGTLRNRFRNTLVQGNLHGKTGTLRGVRALSGYLDNPSYGTIAFSIVVNQPGQSGQSLATAVDQIVLQLAQVDRCE